jgi:hypothetical protein
MSEVNNPTVISADRDKIKAVIREISNAMTRIDAEKEYIKEAIAEHAEKYGLKKSHLSKLAKVYHKQSFSKEKDAADTFIDLYETIIGDN